MLQVELLKSPECNIYKLQDGIGENKLVVYLPHILFTKKIIEQAKEENLIKYIERIIPIQKGIALTSFMNGFMTLNQSLPMKQVMSYISDYVIKNGKATPEKRRYSLIALPLSGLKGFNIDNGKVPCIRISCTAKGGDIRTYAKYLVFKDSIMTLVDVDEELPIAKGLTMLVKTEKNSVIIAKE